VQLYRLNCQILQVLVAQLKDGFARIPDRSALAAVTAHFKPELVALPFLAGKLALYQTYVLDIDD